MGRPRGSYNKEKPFRTVLRKVLLADNAKKLHDIVAQLTALAEGGKQKQPDLQAIDRIADRLDGKVQGASEAENSSPKPIGRIENVIIYSNRPEGEQEEPLDPEGSGADRI